MKKLFTSLLFIGLFVLTAGTQKAFAQITTTNCTIDSIYFEEPNGELGPESLIKLFIQPGHPDCSGQQLEFNIKIEEYEEGLYADDNVLNENYYFDTSGQPVIISFLPGNDYCGDEPCKYYPTFTSINWSSPITLTSDPENNSAFFNTPQKINDAQLDISCGDCDQEADFIFKGVENNGAGLAQSNSTTMASCEITAVEFSPNGDQGNGDTPYLNPGEQTPLGLNITTTNCVSNMKFHVSVYDTNDVDEEVDNVYYEGSLPAGESIIKNIYIPGDDDCDGTINGSPYCNYGVFVKASLANGIKVEKFASADTTADVPDKIKFRCGTAGCDNIEWKKVSSNLIDSNGNNQAQQTQTQTPTYDTTSPCYESDIDPLEEGAQPGYSKNCYEFLAPIPGFTSEGGDIVVLPDGRIAIKDLSGFQLGDYVQSLFNVALGTLMVLSVIMIVIAGVQYMTVESIYGKSDAKKRIVGAITGLILALGIFLILKTINPRLLEINFGGAIDSVGVEGGDFSDIQNQYSSDGQWPAFNFQGDGVYKPLSCPEGIYKVNNIYICGSMAENLGNMLSAAQADGIEIKGGGFRTAQQQLFLRTKNNCPNIYSSPSRDCSPPTAKPGTSNHEFGKAVDLRCNNRLINPEGSGGLIATPGTLPCFNWLKQNAGTYGFINWETENWHWSVDGR